MNLLTHHRLASGRLITAGQLVRALRIARENPNAYFRETLTSPPGFGGTGREVVEAFSRYCTAEINRRGGRLVRQDTPATFDRTQRRLCARARPSECKWCGRSVGQFIPSGRAFCDASCAMAYNS